MAKSKKSANTIISTQEELLSFVSSLSAANTNKGRTRIKATLKDISTLDVSSFRNLDEDVFLSGANIEYNLKGDIGVFSASLLSRRFKRTGFAGRNITLAIPSSLSAQDKEVLTKRISQCANEASVEKVKSLISSGATVSMAEAKDLGLIDQVIDLSKRRGQSKATTAKVASTENSTVADSDTVS